MPSRGELLGGDLERVLALLDQAALHAVGDVGELDAAVADGAAAVAVQHWRALARTSGVTATDWPRSRPL